MSTLSRTVAAIALLPLLMFVPVAAGQSGDGFFRTRGTAIVDGSGTPVVLQGVGLGGWLMPEGYMLHVSAPDGGSPRAIRARIVDLIGEADADRFYEIYRANYVEEKDVAAIKAWGFDHVRLPFHYRLLYDPETGAFLEDGFALVDTFLEWCRAHGLYVILDLHAAPGAQNALNISDSDGTARLWTEPVPYQDQTVALWAEIARRYKDETLVIGYDLINEPVLPDGVPGSALRALYVRLAEAVRAVDPNHILFVEGNWYATDFSALEPAFDDNMVYAFHKYWNGTTKNTIQYLLDLRNRTRVPLWLGESGENSNAWFYLVTSLVEGEGIGWNWWTHKKIETVTAPLSAPFAPGYQAVVNYWNGSGPRPTRTAARDALFAMAETLDLDSCETRPGVLAALFHHDYRRMREPFGANAVPGVVAFGAATNILLDPINSSSMSVMVDGVEPPPGDRSFLLLSPFGAIERASEERCSSAPPVILWPRLSSSARTGCAPSWPRPARRRRSRTPSTRPSAPPGTPNWSRTGTPATVPR